MAILGPQDNVIFPQLRTRHQVTFAFFFTKAPIGWLEIVFFEAPLDACKNVHKIGESKRKTHYCFGHSFLECDWSNRSVITAQSQVLSTCIFQEHATTHLASQQTRRVMTSQMASRYVGQNGVSSPHKSPAHTSATWFFLLFWHFSLFFWTKGHKSESILRVSNDALTLTEETKPKLGCFLWRFHTRSLTQQVWTGPRGHPIVIRRKHTGGPMVTLLHVNETHSVKLESQLAYYYAGCQG